MLTSEKEKGKHILVVLSNTFPYEKGESFLEEEIRYYRDFDQIYITPLNVNDFSQKRAISNPSITLLTLSSKSLSKIRLFGWCIRAGFNKQFFADFSHLIHIGNCNPATLKRLVIFVALGKHSFAQVKKTLKAQSVDKTDSITFYSYWMDFHSYAALLLKDYFPQSKAVSRCHGYDLYEYRNPQKYIPLRKFLLNKLDTVFCISKDGKKYLEEKYPDVQKNCLISRLGTHDYGESAASQERTILRLISCSWISPVKRVPKILDALMQLKDIEIEWTHFGDGASLEDLKRSAEQLPTNIKVHFPGAVPNEKILGIYHTTPYHVFLNVSESEGVPVSIMEAMSFGIPAIATDVGGVSEIVQDQKNGFLLQKEFTDSDLADRIRRFYEMSNEEYARYRKSARDDWKENFNAEKNYSDFTDAIR